MFDRPFAFDDPIRHQDHYHEARKDQDCASFHALGTPVGDFFWCSKANTHGTKRGVGTVATRSPPITARPKGAFWVLDIDIGSMPMIIAVAVISTGRMGVYPAAMAARTASPCAAISPRANDTTKIELAVAVPIHMIAPVNAGTDNVVSVKKSAQMIPVNAPGNAVMMMKRESQD